MILDAGGDINYDMEYSGTPLISALRHNHTPLLEFLSRMALILKLGLGATGFLHLALLCSTPGSSTPGTSSG